MKNKALKVLLLGGFYLQTILPGFGSIRLSFLSCLPSGMLRSARKNLHNQCYKEFGDFLRSVRDGLYHVRDINGYVLADPSNFEYCQQYLQPRKDSCCNWVSSTMHAKGIKLDADAIKDLCEYIQPEYNEHLNRRMYVYVRENGFQEAKQKSDDVINGQTGLESLKQLLESIERFMSSESAYSEALMGYWLLRETPEKKSLISIILEEWLRQKGLEPWTQTELTYGAEINSSESSDSEPSIDLNDEDELLSALVKVLKLGCKYAWDNNNFGNIPLFWRLFAANVNGFPVWYCLSCCGECGREVLSEFVRTVASVIDTDVSASQRFNDKDLFLNRYRFWEDEILSAKTILPNRKEVYLRNLMKFLPQVGNDPRSWPIPDDVLKAIQCYSNWYMAEGAYVNGFAGAGTDYSEARQEFEDVPEINFDVLTEWETDTSCNGIKWTCCMHWVKEIKNLYLSYLSVKGFAPYSAMDAKNYLLGLTKLIRRDVIAPSALKHLLFDKTIVVGVATQESIINKILNNGDKDVLNGLVDLCRAMLASRIVDEKIWQRLLAANSREIGSLWLLLYNKAPDILDQLQVLTGDSAQDLMD